MAVEPGTAIFDSGLIVLQTVQAMGIADLIQIESRPQRSGPCRLGNPWDWEDWPLWLPAHSQPGNVALNAPQCGRDFPDLLEEPDDRP